MPPINVEQIPALPLEAVSRAAAHSASSGGAAATLLGLADRIAGEDPARALAVLEGIRSHREAGREATGRLALASWAAPAESWLHELRCGRTRAAGLGAAFRTTRCAGAGLAFAAALARGLLESASGGHRLSDVVAALAAGGVSARGLAAALILSRPAAAPAPVHADIVINLARDPAWEVWCLGVAAWGREAAAGGVLLDRLRGALAGRGDAVLNTLQDSPSNAAPVVRDADPATSATWHVAPGGSDEDSPASKSDGRRSRIPGSGMILARRSLASLATLDLHGAAGQFSLAGGARGAPHELLQDLLRDRSRDVWDRATAVLGLIAVPEMGTWSEFFRRLSQDPVLPIQANLAWVLATRRPSLAEELGVMILRNLDPETDSAQIPLSLDALSSLAEIGCCAEDPPHSRSPSRRPATAAINYARLRAGLWGRRPSAAPDGPPAICGATLGTLLAPAVEEVIDLRIRWSRVERKIAGTEVARHPEARALSAEIDRLGSVLAGLIEDHEVASRDAGTASAEIAIFAELQELVGRRLADGTEGPGRREVMEGLWSLVKSITFTEGREAPAGDPEARSEWEDSCSSAGITGRLASWASEACREGRGYPLLPVLRSLGDAASVTPESTRALAGRARRLLDATEDVPPAIARSAIRELGRLLALVMDGDRVHGSDDAGDRFDPDRVEWAARIRDHGLARFGLAGEVAARCRSATSAAALAAARRSSGILIGREEIRSALAETRGIGPPPGTIGEFRILRLLGEGGFGAVFECTSERHGRVAVKVARDTASARAVGLDRFLDEAVIIAQLRHPAIPRIHGLGHHQGHPYIAMEYVDGETLGRRLARGGVDEVDARRILVDVTQALVHAHAQDVVHRDLKPANIMVGRDGGVRILDWGLGHCAAVTPGAPPLPGGTRLYAAPEQFGGAILRGRERLVDHFGLGRVAIEVLTRTPIREILVAGGPEHPSGIPVSVLLDRGLPEALATELLALTTADASRRRTSLDPLIALL